MSIMSMSGRADEPAVLKSCHFCHFLCCSKTVPEGPALIFKNPSLLSLRVFVTFIFRASEGL